MRIAQVAPLYESVPPSLYGGTERVVSYLTEALVSLGHDVTLFASGDSRTAARLVAPCPRALRLDTTRPDQLLYHIIELEQVAGRADEFDVIHFHVDYLHFPVSRRLSVPHVTTLHGRLDLPDLPALYREFEGVPLVSISDAQRAPLPRANWQGTVYHGLPLDLYTFNAAPSDYLAFVGRLSPEKRADRAIEIARRAGLPLRIAAKIDSADRGYYDEVLAPLLETNGVEFLGELGEAGKNELLGGARALLFPVDWPEPFGLVMVEAMACGTPVVAYRCGSVPEIMEDGRTGYIVDSIDDAVAAVTRAASLDRGECRRVFERRFSAPRMASDYVDIYERILAPEASHA